MDPSLDSIEFDDKRQVIKFNLNGNLYLAKPTMGNDAFMIYKDALNLMKYNRLRALDYIKRHTVMAKIESGINPFFANMLFEDGFDRDLSTPYENPPSYPVVNGPAAATAPQSPLQGPARPVHEEEGGDGDYINYTDKSAWTQDAADNYPSAPHVPDPNTGVTQIIHPADGSIIGVWNDLKGHGTLKPPKVTAVPRIEDPAAIGRDAMQSADQKQNPATPNKQPEMASVSWGKIKSRFGNTATSYSAGDIIRNLNEGFSLTESYNLSAEFYGEREAQKGLLFLMTEALDSVSSLSTSSNDSTPEKETAEEWLNRVLDNDESMLIQRPDDAEDTNLMIARNKADPNNVNVFVGVDDQDDQHRQGYSFGMSESRQDLVKFDIENQLRKLTRGLANG